MKVLVCGSRTWADAEAIRERLSKLPVGSTVISGAAHGADETAAIIARSLGFEVEEFPADWHQDGIYDPAAGMKRNLLMLDQQPDLVIAFHRSHSHGTQHTITEAQRRGIRVEVIRW